MYSGTLKTGQMVDNGDSKSDISDQIEKIKADLIVEVNRQTQKRSIQADAFDSKFQVLQGNVAKLNDTIANYLDTTQSYNVTLERQVSRLQSAIDSTNLSKLYVISQLYLQKKV